MADLAQALGNVLLRHVPAAGGAWFRQALLASEARTGDLVAAFAAATLRLGEGALPLDCGDLKALSNEGLELELPVSGRDDLARVVLLLRAAARMRPPAFAELVEDCYAHGDNRERRGVLRALHLLPAPERFRGIAIDACRTSVQPVFEAIACENPYPSSWLAELNFNQMVLKALFIGVALERIVGLTGRIGPEIVRMGRDYAAERRAAGRSVPEDIERFLHPPGSPQ